MRDVAGRLVSDEHAVLHDLGNPAHGRGHNRRADRERLRNDLRRRLRARGGEHQQVERRHHLGDVAAEPRHHDVVGEPQGVDSAVHIVEAHPVADDHEARGRHVASHDERGVEEIVVALRSPDVGDESDGGTVEAELVAYGLAAHARTEARGVDTRGHRDDAVVRHARGDHDRADRVARGQHAVGQAVHERAPAENRDRHVAAAHDRAARASRGQRGEPAVDRAVRVDDADIELADQPPQGDRGGDVEGVAHREAEHGEIGRRGLGAQAARRLARDDHVPAVLEEPARLGEDPDLLAAESQGRLGVEHDTPRRR